MHGGVGHAEASAADTLATVRVGVDSHLIEQHAGDLCLLVEGGKRQVKATRILVREEPPLYFRSRRDLEAAFGLGSNERIGPLCVAGGELTWADAREVAEALVLECGKIVGADRKRSLRRRHN